MKKYANRRDAGKILADLLKQYANQPDILVLALPRGGVPVAYEIANSLNLPFDIFIVRKLGVPGFSELAMGAIASNDVVVFNDHIISELKITQNEIDYAIAVEKNEIVRRELTYQSQKKFLQDKYKKIILVDDGIATSATIRSAITALRKIGKNVIIVAVPVAAVDTLRFVSLMADELICPLQVEKFVAVAAWYDEFEQTSDEEVYELMHRPIL